MLYKSMKLNEISPFLVCSPVSRVPNDALKSKLIVGAFVGAVVGFCIGLSFPVLSLTRV